MGEIHISAGRTSPQEARITYIGHATVLIEIDGLRILTDPILRNRVAFLRRRKYGKLTPDLYDNIDVILLSHLHHDHLDPPSLRRVGVNVPLIAPHGSGEFLRGKGIQNVYEMRAGDTASVGPLQIRATYADHSPQRHPFGTKADCLGFVIESEYSIYFPGDTDLFPEMNELAEDLDVALLPVWGWGPTLGTGHLDPKRAAEALCMLRPRLSIPIHWGAFYPTGIGLLRNDFLTFPPQRFAEHAAEVAPDVMVQIVEPGKSLSLSQILSGPFPPVSRREA
jgi:L-ascorbate metabolism protein UlaG (beta-lactamase superfamily)